MSKSHPSIHTATHPPRTPPRHSWGSNRHDSTPETHPQTRAGSGSSSGWPRTSLHSRPYDLLTKQEIYELCPFGNNDRKPMRLFAFIHPLVCISAFLRYTDSLCPLFFLFLLLPSYGIQTSLIFNSSSVFLHSYATLTSFILPLHVVPPAYDILTSFFLPLLVFPPSYDILTSLSFILPLFPSLLSYGKQTSLRNTQANRRLETIKHASSK